MEDGFAFLIAAFVFGVMGAMIFDGCDFDHKEVHLQAIEAGVGKYYLDEFDNKTFGWITCEEQALILDQPDAD